jgi:site-specific DNA recombinase
LNAIKIEEEVWNDIVEFIKNPQDVIEKLVEECKEDKTIKKDVSKEIKVLKTALENTDIEKQNILDLYRKNLIEVSDVESQLQKIQAEKDNLANRIEILEKETVSEPTIKERVTTAESLLKQVKNKLKQELSFEIKREIVLLLVKEILVTSQEVNGKRKPHVAVTYNF